MLFQISAISLSLISKEGDESFGGRRETRSTPPTFRTDKVRSTPCCASTEEPDGMNFGLRHHEVIRQRVVSHHALHAFGEDVGVGSADHITGMGSSGVADHGALLLVAAASAITFTSAVGDERP